MVARAITVVQMLPELDSGGVERGTLELSRFLVRHGHRCLVISGGGRLVAQLQAEGSEHIAWPVGRKHPGTLACVPALRRLLVAQKADILHLRSRVPAWVGYLAFKSLPVCRRPKLVTTFHGFYSVNPYSAVMAKGQRVIAISRAVADHIRDRYGVGGSRVVLIPRGFDEACFNPGAVSKQRIAQLRRAWRIDAADGPVLLMPARLTRLKGHDLFLKALSLMRDLQWTAVCVGDTAENPNYAGQLFRMAESLGLTARVRWPGLCSDMPAAYAAADIAVSPNAVKAEAFGRVAVEAQAMGRPVVATAHGGSLETVLAGKTGWLVAPGSAVLLGKALRQAVQDPVERMRRASAGRSWVAAHFTVEKMCGRTLSVYQQLLAQDNRR